MDIKDLSFTALRNGKELPKATKDQLPRCFWNVKATGDYRKDCATGYRLAMELLRYEEQNAYGHPLLGQIVNDMPRPLTGVEIGFLLMVGVAAPCGIERSERLLRHWGLDPSEGSVSLPQAA